MSKFELSPKEYVGLKTLRNGLKRVFKKYRIPGEFDDFFSTYQADYLSGYRQNQSWDQYAIDYLRKYLGTTGAGGKVLRDPVLSYDIAPEFGDPGSKIPFEMNDLVNIVAQFRDRERMLLGLYLIHGLTINEISFLYSIKPERTKQIIETLLEYLKDRLELVN